MADEPTWEEIFASQPPPGPDRPPGSTGAAGGAGAPTGVAAQAPMTRREARAAARLAVAGDTAQPPATAGAATAPPTLTSLEPRAADPRSPRSRHRGRAIWIVAFLVVVGIIGGGAAALFVTFENQVRSILGWQESNDYVGAGVDDVFVTISNGQVGGDVAQTLVDAGVTKSYDAFYSLLLVADPPVIFQPGSYALKTQMSARAALDALLDPASRAQTRVTIPEGTTLPGVLDRLANVSEATGVTREALAAAAADLSSFSLPAEAPSLEGYLFPATYSFDPGLSASEMLQTLVTEMYNRLDALGVDPGQRHRVLTLAALTQKEGGSSNDFFKIARVWENRLAVGMNLQSDATVSYGSGGTTISTTDEERADASNPYNTYASAGLPIGPISNPGEDAIEATQAPAEGPWLFFVLIDGATGETAFSATYEEHLAAVRVWQQWLREHPGFDE